MQLVVCRWSALLALSVAVCSSVPPVQSAGMPNILLIITDDMRPETGMYGNTIIKTPNLDRLMRRSTVFYNAHAQQALCGPSRTSFLVSRTPDSLKAFSNHGNPYWRRNVGNFTTLPQYFKQYGYRTISLGKVFHPGQIDQNDDYPYSWTDVPYHPTTEKYKNAKVCQSREGELNANVICPVNVTEQPGQTLPDIQTTEEAVRVLDRLVTAGPFSQPFLLAVGLHKPHIPLKYPIQFKDLYPLSSIKLAADLHRPVTLPPIAWNPFTDFKSRHDVASLNVSFPYGELPEHFQAELIQSYYASISYVDCLVGKVLDKVYSSLTLTNNTIIVFMSDHVYDMVELIDLFPTLVNLTGLGHLQKCQGEENTCTEGKSLVPAMLGVNIHSRMNASITQYPRPSVTPQLNSDQPAYKDIHYMGYALKTSTYRYVCWVGFDQGTMTSNLSDVYAEELYDTIFDPNEDRNIIPQPGTKARGLYSTLVHHLDSRHSYI